MYSFTAMLLREEAVDGRFVLRKRGPEHPDDYVLSLIFKSKCTHHLITKGSDGFLRVNGKSYGEIPNVKEVCSLVPEATYTMHIFVLTTPFAVKIFILLQLVSEKVIAGLQLLANSLSEMFHTCFEQQHVGVLQQVWEPQFLSFFLYLIASCAVSVRQ